MASVWFRPTGRRILHKNFAKILCKLYIPALADGCPPCYTEFCNPQRERREQYDELELAGSRRCGRPDLYGRQLEAQRAVRTESDGEKIPEESVVEIEAVRGVKLIVKKCKEEL